MVTCLFDSAVAVLHKHDPVDVEGKPVLHFRITEQFQKSSYALLFDTLASMLDSIDGPSSKFEWVLDIRDVREVLPFWVAGFALRMPPHLAAHIGDAIDGTTLLSNEKNAAATLPLLLNGSKKKPRFIGTTPPPRLVELLKAKIKPDTRPCCAMKPVHVTSTKTQ